MIELLEFKPQLAHWPALIAEPMSRDLGRPTRRPGAGRLQREPATADNSEAALTV